MGTRSYTTAHVARIFDSSRALWTVLIDSGQLEANGAPAPSTPDPVYQHTVSKPALTPGSNSAAAVALSKPAQETPLQNLKSILEGHTQLACRIFRVLFEHMLGFASPSATPHDPAGPAYDLTGSKEHGKALLAKQKATTLNTATRLPGREALARTLDSEPNTITAINEAVRAFAAANNFDLSKTADYDRAFLGAKEAKPEIFARK